MQRSRLPSVARQLLNEVPDADLLERYAQHQSDDAFAQLVARYSRLVWGQCRNLLANDADADDAFQATFLTLARSVKKLKPGMPLGPWLHGMTFRVCKNAQRAKARRTKRERASAVSEAARPVADSQWESAFAAVAEEVQKLPEAQRAAFVLCCIEGRASTEAAASLGQKLGTFSARLSRAKQTLLDRLAKRGLGAGVLALGGVTGSVAVAPAALIQRTLALLPSGVIVPSSIQGLMQGVTGMTMMRIKLLAAGVMVATGFGLSAGSGWFSEATAQYVPPGGIPKAPPYDPNIEKLKADLEKAKAELAKAEADAKAKENQFQLRLTLDTASKYEYERMPEQGMRAKEFEDKLAERAKAGWEFLGQVNVYTGDKGNVTPKLVFRKRGGGMILGSELIIPGEGGVRGQFVAPTTPAPLTTPAVSKVATPGSPVAPTTPIPPTTPPGSTGGPPKAQPGLPPLGIELGYRLPTPLSPAEAEYLNRIAKLEKFVDELRAKGPTPAEKPVTVKFTKEDFGNWDTAELTGILVRFLADKPYGGKNLGLVMSDSVLQVTGTSEAIAEVKGLLKKLKK